MALAKQFKTRRSSRTGSLQVHSGSHWRRAEEVPCEWCGKQFVRIANQTQIRRYCTAECAQGHFHSLWMKRRKYKSCKYCGGLFKPQPNQMEDYVTCSSPVCRKQSMIERMAIANRVRRGGSK